MSAVFSDVPPEGCVAGGATYGTSGGVTVDGPTFGFVCSFKRALGGATYGRNRGVRTISVLAGPVLC